MERSFQGVIRRSMSLAHARTSPKDLSSSKIRRTFIDFFCEDNKHLFIRSSPVFSLLDPTLAFVNAGMNQFKDVFLGLAHPASSRVANSQKCIRIMGKHNDLSQVGQDGSHHTFFEMLGNWSFGDYFKEDACRMSWDLLTKVFGLPPERLYVTYMSGDEALGLSPDVEVREIWRQIGVKESHILPFGAKENFWEGGVTGPCGPCTEIHYDVVPGRTDAGHLVNQNNSEVFELWNLVFTQYNRTANGELENLKTHFVDTGMGFERLVAVLQDKKTNYDTDLFVPLFEAISKHTGHSGYTGRYDGSTTDFSYRVLADHSRMLAVALADGMLPRRQSRVRAALRRALNVSEKIFGANENLLKELTSRAADILSDAYPEVGRNLSKVHLLIDSEAALLEIQRKSAMDQWSALQKRHSHLEDFSVMETPQLVDGIRYIEKAVLRNRKTVLSGGDIWALVDTYGIPLPIVEQLALKFSLSYDMASFEKVQESEKRANKESQYKKYAKMQNTSFYPVIVEMEEKQVPPTHDYFKYDYRQDATGKYVFKEQQTTIEAIIREDQLLNELPLLNIRNEEEIGLVLDRTQFFAKDASQLDDRGSLEIEKKIVFDIKRLIKTKDYVIHFGTFRTPPSDAKVCVKDIGVLRLDEERRLKVMRNHTAIHLLNAALRSLLPVVVEKSSTASPEKLILTFLVNDSTLDPVKDLEKIENYVKEFILHGVSVKRKILNHAQFQEADDVVFVPGTRIVELEIPIIEINSGFKLSKEYCTGTHLLNTSDVKDFIVTKFVKGSYGIQTIHAATGDDCLDIRKTDAEKTEEWNRLLEEVQQCSVIPKVSELSERIKKFRQEVYDCEQMSHLTKLKLESEISTNLQNFKSLKRNLIGDEIEKASEATSDTFVVHILEIESSISSFDLENVKKCKKPLMLVLRRNDRASIRCCVPKEFVSKTFTAEKWLLDTVMPFGGMAYSEANEKPDTWYALKERRFSQKQLDELVQVASDLAKKNIKQLAVELQA